MTESTYDTDFHAWANEQAALLRAGKLAAADIENIAEEIESMSRSEKRELKSRLKVILLHLLKWQFQPAGRNSSWETSIRVQRNDLADHIDDNPSLKPLTDEMVITAYPNALLLAADETKLPKAGFPAKCPYSFQQVLDPDFWPQ